MKLALLLLTATLSSPSLACVAEEPRALSLQSVEERRLEVKPLRQQSLAQLYQRVVKITRPRTDRSIAAKK